MARRDAQTSGPSSPPTVGRSPAGHWQLLIGQVLQPSLESADFLMAVDNWHLLVGIQSQLRAEWMLQIRVIRPGERSTAWD